MLYLIIGPENSGKSARAEALAVSLKSAGEPLVYLATMLPYGREGRKRVERHRRMREGKGFVTIERSSGLDTLDLMNEPVVLLECVVNLTANELFAEPEKGSGEKTAQNRSAEIRPQDEAVVCRVLDQVRALNGQCSHLIVVTGWLKELLEFDKETRRYIAILNKINEHLEKLADRVIRVDGADAVRSLHGGNIYEASRLYGAGPGGWLDFSANINPLGVTESIVHAVEESMKWMIHYPDPDCTELTEAIAVGHQVEAWQVLCGNGAADLIYRIVHSLQPKKALLTAPSFLEYEEALLAVDADIYFYTYPGSEGVECMKLGEGFLDLITPDLDLIFLGNPDNPTGALIPMTLLQSIVQKTGECNVCLVIDECFMDFVSKGESCSMIQNLKIYPHVLVLRSFTKMFAIPGLRLGYMLGGSHEKIAAVRRAGPAWPVSVPAQAAGLAALREKEFVSKTAEYIKEQRNWLAKELAGMGYQVIDSAANYLLFRDTSGTGLQNAKGQSGTSIVHRRDLQDELLAYHILIRRCGNYRNLDDSWYRIAVRKRKENQKLVTAIREIRKKAAGISD